MEKTHQLKRPKSGTQKTKLGPKYKSLKITYLYFFFWKCYFGHTALVYTFLWTLSEFSFILDFLAESLEAIKNQQKRSLILQYSFAQKTSLILRTSTHLTLKIICSCNTAKNLSDFTNFPADMFLCSVRKDICTAPFLDAQELHSWSTLKANVCIFLYISLKKILFPRCSNVLSGGGWVGGRLNKFLKAVRCLDLAKCFTIFHFNWNFWKFNYFLAFRYFYL